MWSRESFNYEDDDYKRKINHFTIEYKSNKDSISLSNEELKVYHVHVEM